MKIKLRTVLAEFSQGFTEVVYCRRVNHSNSHLAG
jgi:hypothetical protein